MAILPLGAWSPSNDALEIKKPRTLKDGIYFDCKKSSLVFPWQSCRLNAPSKTRANKAGKFLSSLEIRPLFLKSKGYCGRKRLQTMLIEKLVIYFKGHAEQHPFAASLVG